jgi:hypothetical protein
MGNNITPDTNIGTDTTAPPNNTAAAGDIPQASTRSWVDIVKCKVAATRFGVVQVIIHDGKVTQIEQTEKIRLVSGHKTP